ncbi:MAG: hypothetical protein FWH28_08970, partial [Clostridiales bacterium]|nr:hypothetical protein [Clostridiales bacterium]
NAVLHMEREPFKDQAAWGVITDREKVKMDVLNRKKIQPSDLIGMDVEFLYDKYRKVVDFVITDK